MKVSILITEDNVDIGNHIKEELDELGYKTDIATSGKECLEKIKNKKPDILILDLMMEGISGIEVLRKLRKKVNEIYIIVNTIVIRESQEKNLIKKGINAYIEKPSSFAKLLAEVEKGVVFIKKNNKV